jgi:hypothetical protein
MAAIATAPAALLNNSRRVNATLSPADWFRRILHVRGQRLYPLRHAGDMLRQL